MKQELAYLMGQNTQLWNGCVKMDINTCSDPSFLENSCSLFPVVLAKVVRLRLGLTRHLLQDPKLTNLKIMFLVRDPRGTINSRIKSRFACKPCYDSAQLCKDLENDLESFEILSKDYPGKLLLIKYESLAKKPTETFREIFKFANISFLPFIADKIKNQTTQNQEGFWSTFRKSAERIDTWRTNLKKSEIDTIQNVCSNVLIKLDYQPILTKSD